MYPYPDRPPRNPHFIGGYPSHALRIIAEQDGKECYRCSLMDIYRAMSQPTSEGGDPDARPVPAPD